MKNYKGAILGKIQVEMSSIRLRGILMFAILDGDKNNVPPLKKVGINRKNDDEVQLLWEAD